MNTHTLHTVLVGTATVKMYVNADNTQVVVFPAYGRYYRVSSDVNALDLAVNLLFHETVNDVATKNVTYNSYLSSLEDTQVIELEGVA